MHSPYFAERLIAAAQAAGPDVRPIAAVVLGPTDVWRVVDECRAILAQSIHPWRVTGTQVWVGDARVLVMDLAGAQQGGADGCACTLLDAAARIHAWVSAERIG